MEHENNTINTDSAEQVELQDLRPEFQAIDGADWSEAVLAVLRASGIGPENSSTVEAALAASEGVSWEFETSAAQLGARIMNRLNAYVKDEELKKLQKANKQVWKRGIDKLNDAQDEAGIYLVSYEHGQRLRNNETIKAKLKVDVELFVNVVRTARQRADYEKSRRFAFEQAAVKVLEGKTKQRITRFKPEKMSDEKKLCRDERTCLNAFARMLKNAAEAGQDAQTFMAHLFECMMAEATKQGIMPDQSSADDYQIEDNQINECPIEDAPTASLPIETREDKTSDEQIGESIRFLETFHNLGCEQFDFTIKDEVTGASTFEQYDFDSAIDRLPYFQTINEQEEKSIIVRPRGNFLQLDDITDIAPYQSLACCMFETSPNNYQAWLAVKPEEYEEAKRRLIKTDASASGATRMVGTWNKKPKYQPDYPLIRLVHDSTKIVTLAELEAAGLLKPKISLVPKPKPKHLGLKKAQDGFPAKYPEYQRCLDDHDSVKFKADASFLRISLLRGFSLSEAKAELGRILAGSSRGAKYITERAKFAASH